MMQTQVRQDMKTERRRFFLEDILRKEDVGPVIAPGERKAFVASGYVTFRPERLEALAPEGAHLRLREIRLRGRTIDVDEDARGGRLVELAGRGLGSMAFAEEVVFVFENRGTSPVPCRPTLHVVLEEDGRAGAVSYLACRPVDFYGRKRKFVVAAGQRGSIVWRSLWVLRPLRLWIHADTDSLDLDVEDVKVGNRSQLVDGQALPALHFARGRELPMDTLSIAQDFSVHLHNRGKVDISVEVELEGMAAVEVGSEDSGEIREFPLGFVGKEETPPGEIAAMRASPELDFTGHRFLVPQPDGWEVVDVTVGGKSQFVPAPAGIPAAMFGPGMHGVRLAWDEAKIGVEVIVKLKNVADKPQRPRAVIFGTAKQRKFEDKPVVYPQWAMDRAFGQVREMPLFEALMRQVLAQGE